MAAVFTFFSFIVAVIGLGLACKAHKKKMQHRQKLRMSPVNQAT
ncbi:MAG: hypothetical protein R3F37_13625 [Candidatus Competibacteraceae bacterium]